MTGTTLIKAAIQGRARVCLGEPGGPILMERRVRNTVVRSGAQLVAALFSGQEASPVNAVAVGIDGTPSSPPYDLSELTVAAADGTPVLEHAVVAIPPENFQIEVLSDQFKVRVSLRSLIPPDRAVSPDPSVARVMIAEAALGVLAPEGDRLSRIYNRVVFEPLPKTRDQELALYWEVDFNFGP